MLLIILRLELLRPIWLQIKPAIIFNILSRFLSQILWCRKHLIIKINMMLLLRFGANALCFNICILNVGFWPPVSTWLLGRFLNFYMVLLRLRILCKGPLIRLQRLVLLYTLKHTIDWWDFLIDWILHFCAFDRLTLLLGTVYRSIIHCISSLNILLFLIGPQIWTELQLFGFNWGRWRPWQPR